MVINHLLNGMILQVHPQNERLDTTNFPSHSSRKFLFQVPSFLGSFAVSFRERIMETFLSPLLVEGSIDLVNKHKKKRSVGV